MRFNTTAATLAALVATAVLTGCSASESKDFNEADVTFAQDMIPHHQQATEMASLAASRTDNEQVLDLASDIAAAQDPEIETMTEWLETWGEETPGESDDMGGMDHSGSSNMPGMMSGDDMEALESAEGTEFDEMFLSMMIEHHKGAVVMAETEVRDGQNPDAVALAKQIQEDQAEEVEEMEELLGS